MKYLITDPMYLIEDDSAWGKCIECWNDENLATDEKQEITNQMISDELERITKKKAWCSQTGYGDWSNEVMGCKGSKIISGGFGADSGMVCVCKYSSKFKDAVQRLNSKAPLVAIIDLDYEPEVIMNTKDPEWTIVEITDGTHMFQTIANN